MGAPIVAPSLNADLWVGLKSIIVLVVSCEIVAPGCGFSIAWAQRFLGHKLPRLSLHVTKILLPTRTLLPVDRSMPSRVGEATESRGTRLSAGDGPTQAPLRLTLTRHDRDGAVSAPLFLS
jgi:hypothetical protein